MNTRRSFFAVALALVATFALPATASDFPKGSPKFVKSYRSAIAEAKKTGKPVIAIFSAAWCGPCQQMKKNVYPSAEVQPLHDKFVWVYLDTDESDNEKVAKEFEVSNIPHIEFVDKAGKSLGQQIGISDPAAFAKTLEGILKKAGPAAPATAAAVK